MILAKTLFKGEADKIAYVNACEAKYEAELDEAVKKILAKRDHHILMLSGPTCSGKTTTARKLIDELHAEGKRVKVISIDDFFYEREVLVDRAADTNGEIDFDSPTTIDLEAFSRAVESILRGEETQLPRFNFITGLRERGDLLIPEERDVYIFEGIQAVYPQVLSLFKSGSYTGIFAQAEQDIQAGEHCFDCHQIRLFRRLVRDFNFRGASPQFTFSLWEGVRENEEKWVLPGKEMCEVRLNSTLGYEISALKPYLCPLLLNVPADNRFYRESRAIVEQMQHIEPISKGYIPETSVYREFLG